jgi:uncharacterized protein YqeY
METRQKLDAALKDAMRSGDEMRKQSVRMVLSAIKLNEVEKGSALDESAVIAIIQKEIKARSEAMQDANKAGRSDLADKAQAETAFLESFLPKQLTAEELAELVRAAIQEVNATGPGDMGKVMKVVVPKVQGRAAGNQVSEAVRKLLQS